MAGDQKRNELFRKKSLESIQSPDSLNNYLKVTSPGVWLVLAAVIALLIGVLIWGIFGRIQVTKDVAVVADNGECVCMIPYDSVDNLDELQYVTVNGNIYMLHPDLNATPVIISESTNPYVLSAGDLEVGDVVVEVPVEAQLADNVYFGSIVTESIRPISMLLQ